MNLLKKGANLREEIEAFIFLLEQLKTSSDNFLTKQIFIQTITVILTFLTNQNKISYFHTI